MAPQGQQVVVAIADMQSLLRLASYNVHSFIAQGGSHEPHRAIEVIAAIEADIIALQEVSSADREGKTALGKYAETHGYRLIFGPTLQRASGEHYGNAMLVRCGIDRVNLHDISHRRREPRGVIEAVVEYQGEKWQVLATHLGLSPVERRQQVKRLLELITRRNHSRVVLMGDLNEWMTWGRPLRWLKSHFQIGHARATFPARYPVFALDRIWVHPGERVHRSYVLQTEKSRAASDHLPIVVEIQQSGGSPGSDSCKGHATAAGNSMPSS